jgi:hypothetical protein
MHCFYGFIAIFLVFIRFESANESALKGLKMAGD